MNYELWSEHKLFIVLFTLYVGWRVEGKEVVRVALGERGIAA